MTNGSDIQLTDIDKAILYDMGIPIDFAMTTMKAVMLSGMGVAFRSRERGMTDIEAFEPIGATKSIDIKTKTNKIGMHRNSMPVNAAINRTADNQPQPLMPTPNEEIIQLTRSKTTSSKSKKAETKEPESKKSSAAPRARSYRGPAKSKILWGGFICNTRIFC